MAARSAALAAASLAAAVVLAGCSTHHPKNTTTTGSATSSSTGSTPRSTSSSTSSTSSTSRSTSTTTAAVNRCTATSVALAIHAGQGVMSPLTGAASYVVAVTNITQRACTIDGYATIALLGTTGAPVTLTAGAQVPGTPALTAPSKVTIQTGASAVFGIGVEDTHTVKGFKHPQACATETAASVTLPGSSAALSWTGSFTACGGGFGAFAAAPAAECNMNQLTFAAASETGTSGHSAVLVEMKNPSAASCTLTGDPVAWYENSAGTVISQTSTIPPKQSPSFVTVKPHAKATVSVFSVEPTTVSAASCAPATTATFVFAPPAQGQLVKLPVKISICTKAGENGLTTSPVH